MDAPSDFKDFHNIFTSLIYKYDVATVFDDFLDYIMIGFTVDNSMEWDKRYSDKENEIFYKLTREWTNIMNKKVVNDNDWFDALGTYYEAEIVSKLGRKGSGQFFTPHNVCTLMAEMNLGIKGKGPGLSINDPTCGSGRCLLAAHVLAPGNYMFAEDLDLTCVKMTICNFLIHGVVGEVVWHNSLVPTDFFGAWRTNEFLNTLGIPHVQKINKEQCFIYQSAKALESPKNPIKKGPITLDSFGVAK
jgi:type I restriction enzyme M protein